MGIRAGISIISRGFKKIRSAFRGVFRKKESYFDPQIAKWMQETADLLKRTPYAPERPQQTYIRTGNMGHGWYAHKFGKSNYSIRNRMDYTGYVVGPEQAWMQRGSMVASSKCYCKENTGIENLRYTNLGRTC